MLKACVSLLLLLGSIQGFQPFPTAAFRNPTVLGAKRGKRSPLGSIAEDGLVSAPKPVKNASKTKAVGGGKVSSDLASWAASQSSEDQPDVVVPAVDSRSEVAEFASFEPKPDRRARQSERLQIDKKRDGAVNVLIKELDEVLEKKNNLQDILAVIKKLMQQEGSNLKALTGGSYSLNYRLAWVGSDDAICHIGTGQHKVPLARLQEIFLTLQGKNRLEVYEVISVFGPFPNIRNTLQGSSQAGGADPFNWKVVYNSMIDGLGKELLADKEENQQRVDLQVYFCDPNAIVAIIPPKDGGVRDDPLESSGANVLLFIREDDLDGKLDTMRVS